MGLFALTIAAGGFIAIGALEALAASNQVPDRITTLRQTTSSSTQPSSGSRFKLPTLSSLSISASVLSLLFIVNSLISFASAINSSDPLGSTLQLQVIAVASLFFLYSVAGILVNFTNLLLLPAALLDMIALFAFVEEFLVYFLQRKDTIGIENRYFDLMLVPIAICVFSTVLELKSPGSAFPRLARAVGLALQGTWFFQMGLSFYTGLVAHGCWLHEKSRGNYTVKCKGHPEYHRARAIATLQFNCHLALLVAVVVSVYSVVAQKNGIQGDFFKYKPLGEDVQGLANNAQFTLDSDEDVDDGIQEMENVANPKAAVIELSINGHTSHR